MVQSQDNHFHPVEQQKISDRAEPSWFILLRGVWTNLCTSQLFFCIFIIFHYPLRVAELVKQGSSKWGS